MIRIGKMQHRVRIERPSDVQGPSGQPVDEWILFASRRAAKESSAGGEHLTPPQKVARVPVLWKLRHLEGVLPTMRLVCEGRVYEILSAIDPTDERMELHISTLERVGESP